MGWAGGWGWGWGGGGARLGLILPCALRSLAPKRLGTNRREKRLVSPIWSVSYLASGPLWNVNTLATTDTSTGDTGQTGIIRQGREGQVCAALPPAQFSDGEPHLTVTSSNPLGPSPPPASILNRVSTGPLLCLLYCFSTGF